MPAPNHSCNWDLLAHIFKDPALPPRQRTRVGLGERRPPTLHRIPAYLALGVSILILAGYLLLGRIVLGLSASALALPLDILGVAGYGVALSYVWSHPLPTGCVVQQRRRTSLARAARPDDNTVAGEILRRREGWRRRLAGQLEVRHHLQLLNGDPRASVLFYGGMSVAGFLGALHAAAPHLSEVIPCAGQATMLLAAVAGALRGVSILRRLKRSLRDSVCPDCAYPLGDLPPGLPQPPGSATLIGPARCPECGAPWPLVPAPLESVRWGLPTTPR